MSDFDTSRANYGYFQPMTTRWVDNDVYGHINNSVYYTFFDTITNNYLIAKAGLDIHAGDTVGFVVASTCQYRTPIRYPEPIEAGLRVNRLGNASVEYGVAIFTGRELPAAAHGTFTHVFVDRQAGTSVRIPEPLRIALEMIRVFPAG